MHVIGDKWNVILYNYYNFPLNMQATLKQKVVDLIKTTPVLVFSKTTCPYCDMA